MASMTPHLSNHRDNAKGKQLPTALSALEAKVESVVGINIAALQQALSNENSEDESVNLDNIGHQGEHCSIASKGAGSPQRLGQNSQSQGQHFEPMDKSVSQTVKLNPRVEFSRSDLLKLLSYLEAELQARDVVIATLKTERIKNMLHYGRVGANDPFLALQRDHVGGVVGKGNMSETDLRNIEETQLQQLENLITQQRRAQQRMRHILREAEKRHTWTVQEFEKEIRNQENKESETAEVKAKEKSPEKEEPETLKDDDADKMDKNKLEKELKRLQDTLEEERENQKQIILMLVEERKQLALQYVEERKRSEDLAQILSEEKGRIDSMAEGLEEESKKSLQMEAELEKQLAEFDTEKQQMSLQIARKDERIYEMELLAEKLQREVEHYKKQLQEAHNVAMFQQTLSISPPRLGVGSSSQRTQPPQLPVKPTSLAQGSQSRLQAVSAAHSSVTKAVQLSATVNSVPVTGPTTGIARGVQPAVGVGSKSSIYSSCTTDVNRPVTTIPYSSTESSWCNTLPLESDNTLNSSIIPASQSGERHTLGRSVGLASSQVVQVSPRVNVSASSSSKMITTSQGGKVTFHVTTNATPATSGPGDQQTILRKPVPPTRSSQQTGMSSTLTKPSGAPPVPPNKPVVPPKKVLDSPPISVEVKPQKVGPQTVKFGITISKTSSGGVSSHPSSEAGAPPSTFAKSVNAQSHALESSLSGQRESVQVDEHPNTDMHECGDSFCHELENFHQLLCSMADDPDIVDNSVPISCHSAVSQEQPKCNPDPLKPLLNDCILSVANSHICSISENSSDKLPSTAVSSCTSHSLSSQFCMSEEFSESNILSLTSSIGSSPLSTSCPPDTHLNNSSHSSKLYESNSSHSSMSNKPPDIQEAEVMPIHSNDTNTNRSTESDIPEPPHSPIDVSTPLTADSMTALHLAAQGNNWQTIPFLVRCGSRVTAEDDEGRTPLYLALLYGCVAAAKALLDFPQCLEHTTKAGCNVLHAAAKSGEVECVSLVVQYILYDTRFSLSLLHLLATAPDHHGHTPVALAMASTSPEMIKVLGRTGLDLMTLVSHRPSVFHVASPASSSEVFEKTDKEGFQCSVWIGASSVQSTVADGPAWSLNSDCEGERLWAAGAILVTKETRWSSLEEAVASVVEEHWTVIDRCIDENLEDGNGVPPSLHKSVGLSQSSDHVRAYNLAGTSSWTKGENSSDCSPFEVLSRAASDPSKSRRLVVQLSPIASVAYEFLIPIRLLEDYLELLDSSRCLVISGPMDGFQSELLRRLVSLLEGKLKNCDRKMIDLSDHSLNHQSFESCVESCLTSNSVVILDHFPRRSWPILLDLLSKYPKGFPGKVIVATSDWHKPPPGHVEANEYSWIQLWYDRPPLDAFLFRYLTRHITSVSAGVPPPSDSLCKRVIRWVQESYARLNYTLMSLGFFSVVRGPDAFVRLLRECFNPADIVRAVKETWNEQFVPSIAREVHAVWKTSPLYGSEAAPNESKVCSMALYVIFQRSFLEGCPPSLKRLLMSYEGVLTRQRSPKEHEPKPPPLPLSPPPDSPAASEWSQDNLIKILGVPPLS